MKKQTEYQFYKDQIEALNKAHVMLSLPSDEDLAAEVVVHFISRNPHPKSKIYLEWEKKAFIAGAKWMQEEIEKRNKRGNGA